MIWKCTKFLCKFACNALPLSWGCVDYALSRTQCFISSDTVPVAGHSSHCSLVHLKTPTTRRRMDTCPPPLCCYLEVSRPPRCGGTRSHLMFRMSPACLCNRCRHLAAVRTFVTFETTKCCPRPRPRWKGGPTGDTATSGEMDVTPTAGSERHSRKTAVPRQPISEGCTCLDPPPPPSPERPELRASLPPGPLGGHACVALPW